MSNLVNWPNAWRDYLIEFHVTRDYFECHEILEEYWKERAEHGCREDFWVAWIQLAVGSYHARRENWNGARKMLTQAQLRFEKETECFATLSVDEQKLFESLALMVEAVQSTEPRFIEIDIPLTDQMLTEAVFAHGPSIKSSDTDPALWEKHRLRDRSDVLAARQQAIELRQNAVINKLVDH